MEWIIGGLILVMGLVLVIVGTTNTGGQALQAITGRGLAPPSTGGQFAGHGATGTWDDTLAHPHA